MKITNLKQVLGTLQELKGYADCCSIPISCDEKCEDDHNYTYLQRRIDDLWEYFMRYMEEHNEGHLPKIDGFDSMKKVLKILELDGQYELKPREIYAADGKLEKIVFEFGKKN